MYFKSDLKSEVPIKFEGQDDLKIKMSDFQTYIRSRIQMAGFETVEQQCMIEYQAEEGDFFDGERALEELLLAYNLTQPTLAK